MRQTLATFALLIALFQASFLHAHQTSPSLLDVRLEEGGRAHATLRISTQDLVHYFRGDAPSKSSLGSLRSVIEAYVRRSVRLHNDGLPCRIQKQSFDWPKDSFGSLKVVWVWQCTFSFGRIILTQPMMTNDRFGYHHLATLTWPGDHATKHVFDDEHPSLAVTISLAQSKATMQRLRAQKTYLQLAPWITAGVLLLLASLTWWLTNRMPPQRKRTLE